MGLFDLLFGGGSYNTTVKKNTVPGRLTHLEVQKLVWELHELLDEGQRKAIAAAFPANTYSLLEIKKILWRLRQQGIISQLEVDKILGAVGKYF